MFRDPLRHGGGLVEWMDDTIPRNYRHHGIIAMGNPPGKVIVRLRDGRLEKSGPRRGPFGHIHVRTDYSNSARSSAAKNFQ